MQSPAHCYGYSRFKPSASREHNPKYVVFNIDRGIQYLPTRYNDKMDDSIDTISDSYDNLLVKMVNRLYGSEITGYVKEQ